MFFLLGVYRVVSGEGWDVVCEYDRGCGDGGMVGVVVMVVVEMVVGVSVVVWERCW